MVEIAVRRQIVAKIHSGHEWSASAVTATTATVAIVKSGCPFMCVPVLPRLGSLPLHSVVGLGFRVLREAGTALGIVWYMDRDPNTSYNSRRALQERLDAAVLAYRSDPSEENKARFYGIQVEYVSQFYAEQAASFISRTSGSRPELVDRGER